MPPDSTVNKLAIVEYTLDPRHDLKIASIYSTKCTAMGSMNTWQKILNKNEDNSKSTNLYIITS